MDDTSSFAGDETGANPPLRLRLPLAMLFLYWPLQLTIANIEMGMLPRFLSRTILILILSLGFLGWWFANRHFDWSRRLAVLAVAMVACALATLAADQSLTLFGILLTGLPFFFTLGTIWLLATRTQSQSLQAFGVAGVAVIVCAVLAMLRFEGIDGRQSASFSWRWTLSAEQQYLTSRSEHSSDKVEPAAAASWNLQPGDWPAFRGPDREGAVHDLPLLDWKSQPPTLVWRQRIGPAWSSVIVVDGHLVTQEQRGAVEAVVCYDAETGKEIWAQEDEVRFEETLSGAGPRATPTFHAGRIYTVGGRGLLNCLNTSDGKKIWSRDFVAETNAIVPQWGVSVSPLIVDDLVVIFAGGDQDRGLVAYKADSGEPAWSSSAGTISYSSPHLLTLAGVRQIVMHDNRALFAVNPADGALLWERLGNNEMFLPMLQPHQVGDHDLVVNWESGIVRLSVEKTGDKWATTERWSSNRLKPSFNDFFIHAGYIYGLDDGILCCTGLDDGKRTWKGGRYGFGQLLLAPEQDQILILSERGEMVRVRTNPDKLEELDRFSAIEGKTWNHPVIAHGKLFVRNGEEIVCYALSADGDAANESARQTAAR